MNSTDLTKDVSPTASFPANAIKASSRIWSAINAGHLQAVASFLALILFTADCNQAKPINIDISNPAGMDAFILQQLIIQGNSSAPPPTPPCSGLCVIFSSVEISGTVSATGGAFGGIANADALCQTAAASLPAGHGSPSEYRALIMDTSGARDLTHNWILHPNVTYTNPNNGATLSTNAGAMFSFPAGATFSSAIGVWDGIDTSGPTWIPSTNNCANWSNNTVSFAGRIGFASSPNFVDFNGTQSCNTFNTGFYCVRF